MPEYIERDSLIKRMSCECIRPDCQLAIGFNAGIKNAAYHVAHAVAAEVEPIRHGQWIKKAGELSCSECRGVAKWESKDGDFWLMATTPYCPHCGAKMDIKPFFHL